MTDAEKVELQDLLGTPKFARFIYRMYLRSGLMAIATSGQDMRDLNFAEGRRSMMLDILMECEAAQPDPSGDGLPIATSIQMFLSAAQMASIKEKPVGRRSGIYGDIGTSGD
jgi:hypothetical protein